MSLLDKSLLLEKQFHTCNPIIIVEDNPNILNKYENVLKKNNNEYIKFLNGLDCLEYIRNLNCTICYKILILTDLSMP